MIEDSMKAVEVERWGSNTATLGKHETDTWRNETTTLEMVFIWFSEKYCEAFLHCNADRQNDYVL